jgi:cell division transport system ATP-binding protein
MNPGVNKEAIIRLFRVYKRFNSHGALIDLSLDISRNEILFITGPSGAGKTTLLKLLYLGEPATEGQILIDGINILRIPHKRIPELRRKFGIIFQDYKLIPTKTVFENIALVLEAADINRRLIRKKVNSVLRTVGLEERQDTYPPSLSGGEQQRIAVARAVVGEPKIILADEPTGNLDPVSAEIILNLLRTFHQRGATVVVATHDKELIRKTGGRVIQLKEGRMVKDTMNPLQPDAGSS